MMKNKHYAVLIKTGDAEIRALENLRISTVDILPIIELTRGRKSKNDKIGLINKRLEKVKEIFKKQTICLDLTTHSYLSNQEIDTLYLFDNGYQNWISFLIDLKLEETFEKIIPTILINSDDPKLPENLISQVEKLLTNFDTLVYRNSLADDACYSDIDLIKNIIQSKNAKFYFVIDCEYIAPGAWNSFAEKTIVRIKKIKSILPETQFIVVSTSFPNNVSEIGKDDKDSFGISEIDLHTNISTNLATIEVIYGDYASINPIRNDEVKMSRGWVPRIDVALPFEIYYFRRRRERGGAYSEAYALIASSLVHDSKFPLYLSGNWGVRQIISCAEGYSPGATPSFWISVRMNMHIEQQISRLRSKF
jgi:hypothetical protein